MSESNNNKIELSDLTVDAILVNQRIKTVQKHILAELHEYESLTRDDNIYGLDRKANRLLNQLIKNTGKGVEIVMTRSTLNLLRSFAVACHPAPNIYFDNMLEPINIFSGEYSLGIESPKQHRNRRHITMTAGIIDKYARKYFNGA